MTVDWYFLKEDTAAGPISESQLKAFAKEGTILPRTPVCRVSDGKRSPWGHAGEIQGLFPELSKLDLGTPICPNCGRASPNGECPTCGLLIPPPFPPEAGSPGQTQPNDYPPKVMDFFLDLMPNQLQDFLKGKGWLKSDDSLRGETRPKVKAHQWIQFCSKVLIVIGCLLCVVAAGKLYNMFDSIVEVQSKLDSRLYVGKEAAVTRQKTITDYYFFSFIYWSLGAVSCFVLSACVSGFASIVRRYE